MKGSIVTSIFNDGGCEGVHDHKLFLEFFFLILKVMFGSDI